MEVGTKYQTKGDTKTAYDLFKKSYDLYNLFWGINLGMTDKSLLSKRDLGRLDSEENTNETPIALKKNDILGKLSGAIGKILDCCRE